MMLFILELPPMADVTQILSQIESGDPSVAERLLPLVYKELTLKTSACSRFSALIWQRVATTT